jgi:hypothetical protein
LTFCISDEILENLLIKSTEQDSLCLGVTDRGSCGRKSLLQVGECSDVRHQILIAFALHAALRELDLQCVWIVEFEVMYSQLDSSQKADQISATYSCHLILDGVAEGGARVSVDRVDPGLDSFTNP